MLEQSLEHVWALFAWVRKSRMDNFVIFLYFSEEKSAEILSCRMIPQLKSQLLSKVFLSGCSWGAACQQLCNPWNLAVPLSDTPGWPSHAARGAGFISRPVSALQTRPTMVENHNLPWAAAFVILNSA